MLKLLDYSLLVAVEENETKLSVEEDSRQANTEEVETKPKDANPKTKDANPGTKEERV